MLPDDLDLGQPALGPNAASWAHGVRHTTLRGAIGDEHGTWDDGVACVCMAPSFVPCNVCGALVEAGTPHAEAGQAAPYVGAAQLQQLEPGAPTLHLPEVGRVSVVAFQSFLRRRVAALAARRAEEARVAARVWHAVDASWRQARPRPPPAEATPRWRGHGTAAWRATAAPAPLLPVRWLYQRR